MINKTHIFVKAINADNHDIVSQGHSSSISEAVGYIFEVNLIVYKWEDHSGPHEGKAYILSGSLYPYAWDATRFKIVKEVAYDDCVEVKAISDGNFVLLERIRALG